MQAETLDVVRLLVGSEAPSARGSLNVLEESRLAGEIHSAWVDGQIAGFPHDDSEFVAAQLWAMPVPRLSRPGSVPRPSGNSAS